MYSLSLTIEEHQALLDVLENSIAELHTEIIHTDRRELKNLLKDRKQVLLKMLAAAKQMETAKVPAVMSSSR